MIDLDGVLAQTAPGHRSCLRRGSTAWSPSSSVCDASRPRQRSPQGRALGIEPAQAAGFEDALAGAAAGRAGGFGCVVGMDRAGQADALQEHRATIVVADLLDLLGAP
jgi:hypothetical protein